SMPPPPNGPDGTPRADPQRPPRARRLAPVRDGAEGRVMTGAGASKEAPAAPARPHYPSFDGLRTIAVLSAIMTHVGFVTGATAQARYGAYIAHLEIGPALFFLISGFLLYRTYVAGSFAGREPMPV